MFGTNYDGAYIDVYSDGGKRHGKASNYAKSDVANIRDMGEWLKFMYSDGSFDAL